MKKNKTVAKAIKYRYYTLIFFLLQKMSNATKNINYLKKIFTTFLII